MAILMLSGVRLGADPEAKGENGNVLTISVAENFYDKEADDKKGTKWHSVAIFNPDSHMFKFVQEHVKKGSAVDITCKQTYKRVKKDGEEKSVIYPNLHALDIEFCKTGGKKDSSGDADSSDTPAEDGEEKKGKSWKNFADDSSK